MEIKSSVCPPEGDAKGEQKSEQFWNVKGSKLDTADQKRNPNVLY